MKKTLMVLLGLAMLTAFTPSQAHARVVVGVAVGPVVGGGPVYAGPPVYAYPRPWLYGRYVYARPYWGPRYYGYRAYGPRYYGYRR